jgi:hypothetical protein
MIVYCINLYVILEEFIYFMKSVIVELTVLFDIHSTFDAGDLDFSFFI